MKENSSILGTELLKVLEFSKWWEQQRCLLLGLHACVRAKSLQSWPTLCNPIDCIPPYRLYPTRVLCPWNSSGKNTGVGCLVLLQGIFPTHGGIKRLLCLLHWQAGSLSLAPPGKPLARLMSWILDAHSRPSLRMGTGGSKNKHGIRGLCLPVPPPASREGKGPGDSVSHGWLIVWSFMTV